MADSDRCASYGDIIPEERQICPVCGNKMLILADNAGICNCGMAIFGEFRFTHEGYKRPINATPTIDDAKAAARVIKAFCNSRNSIPETDCIGCPIRDLCENDPYTWEV